MSTRPPSNDPADIAAWEEEKERLRDEKDFREEMRASAADTKVRLEWLSETVQRHDKRDEERFAAVQLQHEELTKKVGGHTQVINSAKNNWRLVFAVIAACGVIFGILWTIVSAVGKVPS